MNSNIPKSSTQMNESPEISTTSNFQNPSTSTQKLFPVNRVSILKTEEQKKVVRTNISVTNQNNTGNDQHFCVVTEVINRSSNISLGPQNNSFNNGHLDFSLGNLNEELPANQSFQNKTVNIHIADSISKKIEDNNLQKSSSTIKYKLLIKKIATQLKRKVRTPTQGYFYFAFQKGNYPLIIIRKINNQIINHSIELNNDIFRIYTQKYAQYKELIKRIAFLLKKSLKNLKFWENSKFSAQTSQNKVENENKDTSIQVKVTQKLSDTKTNTSKNLNVNIKDVNKENDFSKKTNDKINISLDKNNNSKNIRNNSNNNLTNNKSQYNDNLNNHNQKKGKPQTNTINDFQNNIKNVNSTQAKSGIGSVKNSNFIYPFAQVEDRKKMNLSKKNDNIKKLILNESQFSNKEKNKNSNNISSNNITWKTETHSKTSTTKKDEKIVSININENTIKQTDQIFTLDNKVQIIDKNKIDIRDITTKEEIKPNQNNNTLNINIIKNSNINNNMLNTNINNKMLNNTINNNFNKDFNNSILNFTTNNNMLNMNINNNMLYDNIKNNVSNMNNNNMTFSNTNNNMHYNNTNNVIINKDEKFDPISIQSEPILYNDESNDIEMKNNFYKMNSDIILKKREHIIEAKKNINIGNNIFNNNTNNININSQSSPIINNNNYELNDINTADVNINKKTHVSMNIIPSNYSNMFGITLNNNTLSDINNINSSNPNPLLIKEKNEKRLSFNSFTNSGKKIVIKLSPFKKNEEKRIISKDNSKDTIKDFNQKQISTTTTNIDNSTNTNQNIFSSKISQKTLITSNTNNNLEKENQFVNSFNTELSNNHILIKYNIPIAKDENGQKYMEHYSFWEKYIQYLYNIYLINNEKISLFCFINIIEQYFIWCDNTNIDNNLNFKKILIDTVNKIYNEQEKSLFFSMNKINNLDDLFKKYEIFMDKNKSAYYKFGKEIEIKYDNCVECNCELCSNEFACMNKMSEINKNLIMNVNTDNIFYSGIVTKKNENSSKKEMEKEKFPKFSNYKMKHSFEYQLRYIPQIKKGEIKEEKIEEEKENEVQEEIIKSNNNKNKKRKSPMKITKKSEKYIDLYTDDKIDNNLEKEKNILEVKKEEIDEEDKKSDKKKSNQKKGKKRKSSTVKYTQEESASKSEEKYLKNRKNKKNGKSKGRNKKKEVIKINSDNSSDKSDNSSESSRKKKITYPKIAKKKRGKK